MKKLFCLFLLAGIAISARAQKTDPLDSTSTYILGEVKKRFGVFVDISIDNWEDVEELPQKTEPGKLYVQIEHKNHHKQHESWVGVVKAKVNNVDRDKKMIELELLEDYSSMASKLGVKDTKLTPGLVVQFRWIYKEPEY